MYSDKAIKHFKNPKFAGRIDNPSAEGEEGNLRCGDAIKFYITVKNKVITDIKFQTYGCIAAISASDILCEIVKGKTLDEVGKITFDDVVKVMGDIPPAKLHCSVLAINALKKTIDNFEKKDKNL